ncbi:hypothetical protein HDV02_005436 [Globomyces sp. JEL0801]|nr:hypothetical protein HDV02_005436 [Globomyces sp. JEL0801]
MTLLDLNVLSLSNLQLLIIDEVDRLFTKEKKSGVRSIGERLLKRIMYEKRTQQDLVHEDNSSNSMIIPLQTVFSSATINQKVVKKLETVISDLIVMDFNELEPLSSTIEHQCYYIDHDGELCSVSQEAEQSNQSSGIKAKPVEYAFADDDDKVLKGLSTIIQNENIRKALLFTPSSVSLKSMIKRIESLGLKADKLINLQNYDNPKQFEWGDVNLICATEYECRGLDLPDCTHVFILGLLATDAYVHVSGRVGRAGKKGVCISLLGGKRYVKPYLTMSKILNIKL